MGRRTSIAIIVLALGAFWIGVAEAFTRDWPFSLALGGVAMVAGLVVFAIIGRD